MGMKLDPELERKVLEMAGLRQPEEPVGEAPGCEKEFMADVVKYAEREGWLTYHVHDSRKSKKGFPDLHMLRLGVQVVAELKRSKKEEPKPEQKEWLEEYRKVPGCIVRLWSPEDWPEIKNLLGGKS